MLEWRFEARVDQIVCVNGAIVMSVQALEVDNETQYRPRHSCLGPHCFTAIAKVSQKRLGDWLRYLAEVDTRLIWKVAQRTVFLHRECTPQWQPLTAHPVLGLTPEFIKEVGVRTFESSDQP